MKVKQQLLEASGWEVEVSGGIVKTCAEGRRKLLEVSRGEAKLPEIYGTVVEAHEVFDCPRGAPARMVCLHARPG